MAYTKTIWTNDTVPDIDADNLNRMEQGIFEANKVADEQTLINRINFSEKDFTILNKYIKFDTGTEGDSNTYKRSDFIPVKAGEKIFYYGYVSATVASIAFYSSKDLSSYVKANSICYSAIPTDEADCVFEIIADGFVIITVNQKNKFSYVYFETAQIPKMIQKDIDDVRYIMKNLMNEKEYRFSCLSFTTAANTRLNSEGAEASSTSWNVHTISVNPHDILLISGGFANTSFSFGYDDENNIVCRVPLGASSSTLHEEKNVVFVVPYNVTKIRISASTNSKYSRIKLAKLIKNDITNEYIASHMELFSVNGLAADGTALYDAERLNAYFTTTEPKRIVIKLPSGYGARINEIDTGGELVNRSDYYSEEGVYEFFVKHPADLYVYFVKINQESLSFLELENSGCELWVNPEQNVNEDARLVDKSYLTPEFVFKSLQRFAQGNLYDFTYNANYKASERILCYPGDVLYYTLFGGTSVNVIYVFDIDGNVIDSVLGDGYNVAKTGSYTFTRTCFIRLTTRMEQKAEVSFNKRTYWDIMNRLESIGDGQIPSYWISEVEDTLTKVRANQISCGANCVEFMFVTDWHWNNNAQQSPSLINRIAKKSGIKNILMGGDAISYYSPTKAGAIEEAFGIYDGINSELKVFTALGNHDRNGSSGNTDRTIMLTDSEAYAIYTKRSESFAVTEKSVNYGYWDFPAQKVRIVMFYLSDSLYPGMVEEQYIPAAKAWAISKMLELDSTWTVILLTHGYYYSISPEVGITETNLQIKDDILECKKNMAATLAFWIIGHVHDDYNAILTSRDPENEETLLQIVCNCDAMMGRMYQEGLRILGTDTEQSFDIVQVDTLNKKVYLTRCGAGSDREFSYT